MGDPAGIGGEIIIKALPHITKRSIPVIIGDYACLEYLNKKCPAVELPRLRRLKEGKKGDAEFIDMGLVKETRFGKVDPGYGLASYMYILEALKLCFAGEVSAIVTGPINKTSIHEAGIDFMGHTELLAHYGSASDYVMMMANRRLRVSLVTIHIPLKDVPPSISMEKVFSCVSITYRSLKELFKIERPLIKVCGLNPHAGEEGLIGGEESVIAGAVEMARSLGMDVEGPFPSDTLFHRVDCDAFVAMYHDQGLIPVKTIDFGGTVNITLGLPFIRTSPGHGTGYDIAGTGAADPSGLIRSYRTAEALSGMG